MVSVLSKYNGLLTILPCVTLDFTKCRLNCRVTSHLSLKECLLPTFRRSMKSKWRHFSSKNKGRSLNIAIITVKRKRKYSLSSHLWKTRKINFSPFILIKSQHQSMIYATTNLGNGKMTILSQIKISSTHSLDRDLRRASSLWTETNLKISSRLNFCSSSFSRLTNKRWASWWLAKRGTQASWTMVSILIKVNVS